MEHEALRERCDELAAAKQWEEIDSICERVLADPSLPGVERASWLRRWAFWSYQESRSGGRVLYSRASTLLHEALPWAKDDPYLQGRIYEAQTAIGSVADVEKAARSFWKLRAKHPELDPFTGYVYFNLGASYGNYIGDISRSQLQKAARAYWKAASLLDGVHRVQAWHNYAETCIDLGWYRAAEAATRAAESELSDPHIFASLKGRLAAVQGKACEGLAIVDAALSTEGCGEMARAYLMYVRALALHKLGLVSQAFGCIDQSWRYAIEHESPWLINRLSALRRVLREAT